MSQIPDRDTLIEKLDEMERRLQDLESAARLPNASVKQPGRIEFFDENDNLIFTVGEISLFGTDSVGLLVQDANGNNIVEVGDDGNGYGFNLRDLDGNGVLVPDRLGYGLSRPYLVGDFYPLDFAALRTTSSGSFDTKFSAIHNVQHKGVRVDVGITADAGTTGEWRVYDSTDAKVICSARSIPDGFTGTDANTGDFDDDDYGQDHTLELQIRVTSGGGNVGVEPHLLRGQQS